MTLKYFKNHPNIVNIKTKSFDESFLFRETNFK